MSSLEGIERWATENSAEASRRLLSRHIDEFGLSFDPDSPQRTVESISAFRALCRGVDWQTATGISAGLVIPLEAMSGLPSPEQLVRGLDYLRTCLSRHEPPGLYLFPLQSLSQWSDREEDYRFPIALDDALDVQVDSAFVRFWRSADEIIDDDDYSGAIYLFRHSSWNGRQGENSRES